MRLYGCDQFLALNRLGKKTLHADLPAERPVFVGIVGGERQDGNVMAAGEATDGARGGESVHARHLQIHQDQVDEFRRRLPNPAFAVIGEDNVALDAGKDMLDDALRDLAVLDDQN